GAFREHGDRAVVELLALGVAPWCVQHLADLGFADVARDDAVEQARGVAAGDQVLVEGRDVEQRGGAADRVVLTVVRQLVRARHDVAGPPPPGLTLRERGGALVKRGLAQRHRGLDSAGANTTSTRKSSVIEWKR